MSLKSDVILRGRRQIDIDLLEDLDQCMKNITDVETELNRFYDNPKTAILHLDSFNVHQLFFSAISQRVKHEIERLVTFRLHDANGTSRKIFQFTELSLQSILNSFVRYCDWMSAQMNSFTEESRELLRKSEISTTENNICINRFQLQVSELQNLLSRFSESHGQSPHFKLPPILQISEHSEAAAISPSAPKHYSEVLQNPNLNGVIDIDNVVQSLNKAIIDFNTKFHVLELHPPPLSIHNVSGSNPRLNSSKLNHHYFNTSIATSAFSPGLFNSAVEETNANKPNLLDSALIFEAGNDSSKYLPHRNTQSPLRAAANSDRVGSQFATRVIAPNVQFQSEYNAEILKKLQKAEYDHHVFLKRILQEMKVQFLDQEKQVYQARLKLVKCRRAYTKQLVRLRNFIPDSKFRQLSENGGLDIEKDIREDTTALLPENETRVDYLSAEEIKLSTQLLKRDPVSYFDAQHYGPSAQIGTGFMGDDDVDGNLDGVISIAEHIEQMETAINDATRSLRQSLSQKTLELATLQEQLTSMSRIAGEWRSNEEKHIQEINGVSMVACDHESMVMEMKEKQNSIEMKLLESNSQLNLLKEKQIELTNNETSKNSEIARLQAKNNILNTEHLSSLQTISVQSEQILILQSQLAASLEDSKKNAEALRENQPALLPQIPTNSSKNIPNSPKKNPKVGETGKILLSDAVSSQNNANPGSPINNIKPDALTRQNAQISSLAAEATTPKNIDTELQPSILPDLATLSLPSQEVLKKKGYRVLLNDLTALVPYSTIAETLKESIIEDFSNVIDNLETEMKNARSSHSHAELLLASEKEESAFFKDLSDKQTQQLKFILSQISLFENSNNNKNHEDNNNVDTILPLAGSNEASKLKSKSFSGRFDETPPNSSRILSNISQSPSRSILRQNQNPNLSLLSINISEEDNNSVDNGKVNNVFSPSESKKSTSFKNAFSMDRDASFSLSPSRLNSYNGRIMPFENAIDGKIDISDRDLISSLNKINEKSTDPQSSYSNLIASIQNLVTNTLGRLDEDNRQHDNVRQQRRQAVMASLAAKFQIVNNGMSSGAKAVNNIVRGESQGNSNNTLQSPHGSNYHSNMNTALLMNLRNPNPRVVSVQTDESSLFRAPSAPKICQTDYSFPANRSAHLTTLEDKQEIFGASTTVHRMSDVRPYEEEETSSITLRLFLPALRTCGAALTYLKDHRITRDKRNEMYKQARDSLEYALSLVLSRLKIDNLRELDQAQLESLQRPAVDKECQTLTGVESILSPTLMFSGDSSTSGWVMEALTHVAAPSTLSCKIIDAISKKKPWESLDRVRLETLAYDAVRKGRINLSLAEKRALVKNPQPAICIYLSSKGLLIPDIQLNDILAFSRSLKKNLSKRRLSKISQKNTEKNLSISKPDDNSSTLMSTTKALKLANSGNKSSQRPNISIPALPLGDCYSSLSSLGSKLKRKSAAILTERSEPEGEDNNNAVSTLHSLDDISSYDDLSSQRPSHSVQVKGNNGTQRPLSSRSFVTSSCFDYDNNNTSLHANEESDSLSHEDFDDADLRTKSGMLVNQMDEIELLDSICENVHVMVWEELLTEISHLRDVSLSYEGILAFLADRDSMVRLRRSTAVQTVEDLPTRLRKALEEKGKAKRDRRELQKVCADFAIRLADSEEKKMKIHKEIETIDWAKQLLLSPSATAVLSSVNAPFSNMSANGDTMTTLNFLKVMPAARSALLEARKQMDSPSSPSLPSKGILKSPIASHHPLSPGFGSVNPRLSLSPVHSPRVDRDFGSPRYSDDIASSSAIGGSVVSPRQQRNRVAFEAVKSVKGALVTTSQSIQKQQQNEKEDVMKALSIFEQVEALAKYNGDFHGGFTPQGAPIPALRKILSSSSINSGQHQIKKSSNKPSNPLKPSKLTKPNNNLNLIASGTSFIQSRASTPSLAILGPSYVAKLSHEAHRGETLLKGGHASKQLPSADLDDISFEIASKLMDERRNQLKSDTEYIRDEILEHAIRNESVIDDNNNFLDEQANENLDRDIDDLELTILRELTAGAANERSPVHVKKEATTGTIEIQSESNMTGINPFCGSVLKSIRGQRPTTPCDKQNSKTTGGKIPSFREANAWDVLGQVETPRDLMNLLHGSFDDSIESTSNLDKKLDYEAIQKIAKLISPSRVQAIHVDLDPLSQSEKRLAPIKSSNSFPKSSSDKDDLLGNKELPVAALTSFTLVRSPSHHAANSDDQIKSPGLRKSPLKNTESFNYFSPAISVQLQAANAENAVNSPIQSQYPLEKNGNNLSLSANSFFVINSPSKKGIPGDGGDLYKNNVSNKDSEVRCQRLLVTPSTQALLYETSEARPSSTATTNVYLGNLSRPGTVLAAASTSNQKDARSSMPFSIYNKSSKNGRVATSNLNVRDREQEENQIPFVTVARPPTSDLPSSLFISHAGGVLTGGSTAASVSRPQTRAHSCHQLVTVAEADNNNNLQSSIIDNWKHLFVSLDDEEGLKQQNLHSEGLEIDRKGLEKHFGGSTQTGSMITFNEEYYPNPQLNTFVKQDDILSLSILTIDAENDRNLDDSSIKEASVGAQLPVYISKPQTPLQMHLSRKNIPPPPPLMAIEMSQESSLENNTENPQYQFVASEIRGRKHDTLAPLNSNSRSEVELDAGASESLSKRLNESLSSISLKSSLKREQTNIFSNKISTLRNPSPSERYKEQQPLLSDLLAVHRGICNELGIKQDNSKTTKIDQERNKGSNSMPTGNSININFNILGDENLTSIDNPLNTQAELRSLNSTSDDPISQYANSKYNQMKSRMLSAQGALLRTVYADPEALRSAKNQIKLLPIDIQHDTSDASLSCITANSLILKSKTPLEHQSKKKKLQLEASSKRKSIISSEPKYKINPSRLDLLLRPQNPADPFDLSAKPQPLHKTLKKDFLNRSDSAEPLNDVPAKIPSLKSFEHRMQVMNELKREASVGGAKKPLGMLLKPHMQY